MKKAFLLFAVMMTMTLGAIAQNGNGNNQLINKARVAANQAGCFSGWNGQVSAQVTVVSSCFVGGFVTEVLFVPVCHGPGCDTVRLAPLAKVTFYCTDDVVGSVECI
ncbi:MAG: hypothetical protein ACJAUD_000288 [Crocinitomicaceae bacterium]|jgi:hypothetical protein